MQIICHFSKFFLAQRSSLSLLFMVMVTDWKVCKKKNLFWNWDFQGVVYIWWEQPRVKWDRAEIFSSHGKTRQQVTRGNYILHNMKMATKHFKVVFIAILNYLREQWFYSLVVYRNPPHPSPPLSTPPHRSLPLFPPLLFASLLVSNTDN